MNQAVNIDQFRMTSIPYCSTGQVIFTGTPLKRNSYKINNSKYYITIKSAPAFLPVMPSIGQHWSVKGKCIIEEMEIGNYVMEQHSYESPDEVSCSLPDTGEQLIKFIAKEKDFKGIGESKARSLWQLLGEKFHSTIGKTHLTQEIGLEVF